MWADRAKKDERKAKTEISRLASSIETLDKDIKTLESGLDTVVNKDIKAVQEGKISSKSFEMEDLKEALKEEERKRDDAIAANAKYAAKITKAEADFAKAKATKEKFDLADREKVRNEIAKRLENQTRIADDLATTIKQKVK